MASTQPILNPLQNPTLDQLLIRQLEYAALLAFYQAMHGVDFFGPGATPIDPVTVESLSLGLVGYFNEHVGTPENPVENLATMGFKLHVTVDDKTTEIKSTEQYRKLLSDRSRLVQLKHCFTTPFSSVMYCWKSTPILQVPQEKP
jgi:hypothetical protein